MKIIGDSCCDLNDQLKDKMAIESVPLTIYVDKQEFLDDENLDTKALLDAMKNSENSPKTASPSPQKFMDAYKGSEHVFVVTLSSALSSTYNNAVLAKEMLLEEVNGKFIHVFDSLSASVGETLVAMKIQELFENNIKDTEIVEKVNDYINDMKTFFVLESLENLIKAGRLGKIKGKIASALSIKPVMGSTDDGNIRLVKNVRGSRRARKKLVDVIGEQGEKLEEKVLGIAHCNCFEKAQELKKEVMKQYDFKDIIIVEAQGISTVYANDGGLIIAF